MPDVPLRPLSAHVFGESDAIRHALQQAHALAGRPVPLLLLAEPGLETTLLAGQVHLWSGRSGPFHRLFAPELAAPTEHGAANPAVLADYFAHKLLYETFQQAQGGTLFVEDIDALPPAGQAIVENLLTQQARGAPGADVRVVASTSVDLAARVAAGRFRAGLLQRLMMGPLYLPPLREREDDVLLIADRMLAEHPYLSGLPRVRLHEDAVHALLAHPWPGNLVELERVVVRAALRSEGGPIRGLTVDLALVEAESLFELLAPDDAPELTGLGDDDAAAPPAPAPRAVPDDRAPDARIRVAVGAAMEKLGRLPPEAPQRQALRETVVLISTHRVLRRLREDGRVTERAVAELTGLPPRAARRLLRDLERDGMIVSLGVVDGQPTWGLPPEA